MCNINCSNGWNYKYTTSVSIILQEADTVTVHIQLSTTLVQTMERESYNGVQVTLHCCVTMAYRKHYKDTMHYRQAMPHNSISSALSVSTAVGLGYVTVWTTWQDRTTSKPSINAKFYTINITTECWHGGKHWMGVQGKQVRASDRFWNGHPIERVWSVLRL